MKKIMISATGIFLLLAIPAALAQEPQYCAINQARAADNLTKFVEYGDQIKKLDYEFKQIERQWQADLTVFLKGGEQDARLGNQLNRNWKALADTSRRLKDAVLYYRNHATGYCSAMDGATNCSFVARDASNTQKFCSQGAALQKGLDDALAQAAKFNAPPGGDWRRGSGIPYVESWKGRVFIIRGVRTLAPNSDEILVPGDVVAVEAGSNATIYYRQSSLQLAELTKFEIAPRPTEERRKALSLFFGGIWSTMKDLIQGESFEIKTPTAVTGSRG